VVKTVRRNKTILRAVLRGGLQDADIVGHTLGIDAEAVVVAVAVHEELTPGAAFDLELSFQPLIAPVHLTAEATESQPGRGPGDPASVTLSFRSLAPAGRVALGALLQRMDAPRVESKASYKVLLVEDNDLIRDLFAHGLQRYFRDRHCVVEVDHASTGVEGLAMLSAGHYDLAIVDYYLPAMMGSELVRRLRADPALGALPVVAISVGGPEARDDFLAAGADVYLDKPLVLRDLVATLDGLTAGGPP
jgi:CheY-like chemotaxis protein